eukprot:TRINITY_DN14212_c0_g1_i1.p1 TRINITY_DN14212_c0_g1~~TRINITY_DN14212_c0_g1_i1.p1  ORF type:complete len:407 (+),score=129.31 TRINITY_DN14212_c0_g1_i1:101-1222(+)
MNKSVSQSSVSLDKSTKNTSQLNDLVSKVSIGFSDIHAVLKELDSRFDFIDDMLKSKLKKTQEDFENSLKDLNNQVSEVKEQPFEEYNNLVEHCNDLMSKEDLKKIYHDYERLLILVTRANRKETDIVANRSKLSDMEVELAQMKHKVLMMEEQERKYRKEQQELIEIAKEYGELKEELQKHVLKVNRISSPRDSISKESKDINDLVTPIKNQNDPANAKNVSKKMNLTSVSNIPTSPEANDIEKSAKIKIAPLNMEKLNETFETFGNENKDLFNYPKPPLTPTYQQVQTARVRPSSSSRKTRPYSSMDSRIQQQKGKNGVIHKKNNSTGLISFEEGEVDKLLEKYSKGSTPYKFKSPQRTYKLSELRKKVKN